MGYFFFYYPSTWCICLLCSASPRSHAACLEEKGCYAQSCYLFQYGCLSCTLLTVRNPPTREAFLRILGHCSRMYLAQSTSWETALAASVRHAVLTCMPPSPAQPLHNIHSGGPVIPIILLETLTYRMTGRMHLWLSPNSHNPPSLCPCQA